jgi:uncharacterized protein (DUF2062 family)
LFQQSCTLSHLSHDFHSVSFDFQVQKGIPINILAFIPAVILGIIGGFLGALYTFMNLKVVKARRRLLAGIRQKWKRNIVKIGEPMLIMVSYELLIGQLRFLR